jgi:catechol 2,3-dioxygenase-like lactoylglutathione lyase family enzyme
MKNPVPLDSFLQIALVVDDIDAALDGWCAVLNMDRPDVYVTEAKPNPVETYRGNPACYGLKFAMIKCPERGFILELHEPDANPSTFREFLDTHGNGVHHLGFNVGPARDAVVDQLESLGYQLRVVGTYGDAGWTVVDSESTLGTNLNIKPSFDWTQF